MPHRTTIQLEPEFWSAIEGLAKRRGSTWRQWAEQVLADRPAGAGAASWLRVQCLRAYLKKH